MKPATWRDVGGTARHNPTRADANALQQTGAREVRVACRCKCWPAARASPTAKPTRVVTSWGNQYPLPAVFPGVAKLYSTSKIKFDLTEFPPVW